MRDASRRLDVTRRHTLQQLDTTVVCHGAVLDWSLGVEDGDVRVLPLPWSMLPPPGGTGGMPSSDCRAVPIPGAGLRSVGGSTGTTADTLCVSPRVTAAAAAVAAAAVASCAAMVPVDSALLENGRFSTVVWNVGAAGSDGGLVSTVSVAARVSSGERGDGPGGPDG